MDVAAPVSVRRRDVADIAASVVPLLALLLAIAFSPAVSVPAWAPRAAVLLIVAALGVPTLVALWRSDARVPAIVASALVVVAAVSTATSGEVARSVTGAFGWGTGLLFVAGLAGAWALGVTLSPLGRTRLERALLVGFGINIAVAVIQLAIDPGIAEVRLVDDRATGLLGNPVHLAALGVGTFALVARRAQLRPWPWAIAAAAAATGVQVSGSRVAVALIVVAVGIVGLGRAGRGHQRGTAALAVAVAAGISVGAILSAAGGGVSSTQRVTAGDTSEGVVARTASWWDARHAVARSPLVGAGPGLFRDATSRDRSETAARLNAPDALFFDAHNLVVEYAVTTGLLGLAAFLAWIVLALRHTSGPLLAFGIGVLALHLVEPQMVGTTPLAFLAIGAARRPLGAPIDAAWPRWVGGALVVPALVAGAILVLGDFHLDQAGLDFDLTQARAARTLLPWWLEPYETTARIEAFRSVDQHDIADLDLARAWHERAVAHDPTSPFQWNELAEVELRLGHADRAAADFATALHNDPWSVRALLGRARSLDALGQTDEAIALLEQAERAHDSTSARALLAELRSR